ncbi:helix-turn-helix domain-containing protein [Hwanghaeella sp.]|uniref:helix-turn-helix domain-containing protein n=1 Tax=Hwanghaeella sp. TaxID=2605943 RepID=UPI003CCC42B4
MSRVARDHVWKNSKASGTALVLMLALAEFANDDMEAWPSIRTLAMRARVDRRNVIRHVQRLIEAGEIKPVRTGRRSVVVYRITIAESTTSGAETSGDTVTGDEIATGDEYVTPTSDAGATRSSGDFATRTVKEPSVEPSVPPSSPPERSTIGLELEICDAEVIALPRHSDRRPNPSTEEPFDAFWAFYPKRQGSDPKQEARKLFDKAVSAGANPADIIEGARLYAAQCEANGNAGTKYVAQAKTWLNQERWADDYPDPDPDADGAGDDGISEEIFRVAGIVRP